MQVLTNYRKNCDSFQQFQYIHSLTYGTHAPCGPLSGDMGKVGIPDNKAERPMCAIYKKRLF